MQIRVPLYRTNCLIPLAVVACLALAGCYGTVTRYQPDGVTPASVAKVPIGMQYDVATDKLSGDPNAVEAMGAAAAKVIDVAGDELARYAIDKAAQANRDASGAATASTGATKPP